MPDNLVFSAPGICLLILACLAAVYRHVNRVPTPEPRPVLHAVIPLGACRLVVGGMNRAALDAAFAYFPRRFDGSMLTPLITNPAAMTFTVEFAGGISAADLMMLVSHIQFSAPGRTRPAHVLVAAEVVLSPLFGAIGEALDRQQAVIYVPTGSSQLDTVHVDRACSKWRWPMCARPRSATRKCRADLRRWCRCRWRARPRAARRALAEGWTQNRC